MALGLLRGTAAGAAGTTALNAATYLDMAVRGRGSSSAPQDLVEAAADQADIAIPGQGDERENRLAGLAPCRAPWWAWPSVRWPADWAADALPHLVYGAVTYATLHASG